ncbi:bis(5'-nucleosyl)-tetraphosphatase PrpE [Virgibacillus sp. CBA3643]|uniref:bis(5'-nucleosyl)-tetraphosphatase PrpE n=1 Tax=Virgibacillus sp. CBA3643 TaxID=2942278 RepID=UPI0035A2E676
MKIDVIGDVHGCMDELHELFKTLGYRKQGSIYIHPDARIPVFLGDITDRGPASLQVIRLVYDMVVVNNKAQYVPGNHCNKLYRYFLGNNVQVRHELETTVAEYNTLDTKEQEIVKDEFMTLVEQSPLYLQLPEVQAIVAHAGIKESYIGRTDKKVKSFVLYGDVTGNVDKYGRPIRGDWAQDYHGSRWIVYGHTPVKTPRIVNKTINIDTGCVFGNALSAFRLPEEKIIAVPSKQAYAPDKFRSFPS